MTDASGRALRFTPHDFRRIVGESPLDWFLATQCLPGETAEAHDHPDPGCHVGKFCGQPWCAGIALGCGRLVDRWRTADRRGHPGPKQPLAVAGRGALRRRGQATPVQRGEQDVTAAIPGEDPAGAVAPVRGRCEAQDQHARLLAAPARNRPAPVGLGPQRPAFG